MSDRGDASAASGQGGANASVRLDPSVPVSEPTLSDVIKAAILAEVKKYPEPRSALLMALHLVQREIGYVPLGIQRELAALLGLRPIEVREVVTFYPMYHEHPVGRRHVQVCVNLACALAGARAVVRGLEHRLEVRSGACRADGAYSLEEVQCLGSCGTAVCVQVNNEPFLEGVGPERLDDVVRAIG